MEVRMSDTFFKSFNKLNNTYNPWRWEFYQDKWRSFKRAIWALRKYFKVTTKMVPWDSHSVLLMMKFQIEILSDYIEKKGIEIDEDRLPKVENMKRFIELANHKIEDDYSDRCGYDHSYGYDLVPVEDNPTIARLVSSAPKEVEENNSRAMKEAHELEEKEWNEMFELLKEMRSWWD
jgi:hypothetical protein